HLLQTARKHRASDIHLVVGLPPVFRIDGELVTSRTEALVGEQLQDLVDECIDEPQRRQLERDWQLCFSTSFGGQWDRARVTVYRRNGFPEMSIRISEREMRSREELGLPPIVDELVGKPNGLILVTGPTGVGKTTTFHYMLERINSEKRIKIITIEDPIEFVHSPKRAVVVQQELLTDVHDFGSALRHVLRQDPNVIAIGEMRDKETIYTALVAAETGHLVIGTLHTPDATQAIQRIVSVFAEGSQVEIRQMLANSLQAVLAQQLLPRAGGQGRVLCSEVLIGTPGVRNIIREGAIHKLYTEMQAGRRHGMMTMDHMLLELYQRGEIGYDTAVSMARFPEAIQRRSA
ncbi:MAG: PilT/PilU family type 4a pilus ATPase, partial [Deltaproteobacteria bacterium]|nr:PilT/PilU family type 4a pilus ATPase [Deltaproteobacteria bacterium]